MESENLEEMMMKMVKKNPMEFIKFLESKNLNFVEVAKDLDLGRKIVQDRYNIDSSSIIEPEVQLGGRREAIELMVNKLYFGEKISLISELYSHKKDPFVKIMRKVQDLRNDVAHGRFNELNYEGYELSNARGQLIIIGDMMNALQKK